MKHIFKIAFLSLIAALTLSACERNRHTPDPGTEDVPISFSTLSQDAPVKADDAKLTVDFGVWGIARYKDDTKPPYIPWLVNKENKMAKVSSQGVPETGGYWFSGYTYNFIALAPYELGTSTLTFTTEPASTNDALTLEFSMVDKYEASDYAFDLMGAVGEKEVTEAKTAGSQKLRFWHLLAKLRINVTFAGLPSGTTGTVTGLRLYNVATERTYTITDINEVFDVDYVTSTDGQTPMTIILSHTDDITDNDMLAGKDNKDRDCQYKELHIIPQSIEDFEMDLDFKIGDVQTNGYKLNLESAKYTTSGGVKTPVVYRHNQWSNWNITITPKGIAFDVTVTPWTDATGDEFDFE